MPAEVRALESAVGIERGIGALVALRRKLLPIGRSPSASKPAIRAARYLRAIKFRGASALVQRYPPRMPRLELGMRKHLTLLIALLVGACGSSEEPAPSRLHTVTVSGWVRAPDGSPLPPGRVTVDPWLRSSGLDDPWDGSPHVVPVDENGRFSVVIDGVPRNQSLCVFLLSFDPRDGHFLPDQERLSSRWMVKHPIPDQLAWGAVRLISPASVRPFADMPDDELEAQVRTTWSGRDHIWPFQPWHALCLELAQRPESRWESLANELLESTRAPKQVEDRTRDSGGGLELLTALRRHQGRADPIAFEVMRGSDFVVDAPAMPRIAVRIVNRDEYRLVLEGYSWRWVGQRADGTPLLVDRFVPLGYSGVPSFARLEPGQSKVEDVESARHLLPFQGAADARLLFCDGVHIEDGLADLNGMLVFSTDPAHIEVRAATLGSQGGADKKQLWPVVVDDDRIRAWARESQVPLSEQDGVPLVATRDCARFIDVLAKHDVLLSRVEAWRIEELDGGREVSQDKEFTNPGSGVDADDGARSLLAARLWLEGGSGSAARYAFRAREHARP